MFFNPKSEISEIYCLPKNSCATVVGFADHSTELKDAGLSWRSEPKGSGGLERVAECFEIIFQKCLTTNAKAGHNPISLLLTTNCESELFEATGKASRQVLRKEIFKNT
ncbi:MAG TPA: hypothetical protein VGE36_16660 [Roseateles sp.]